MRFLHCIVDRTVLCCSGYIECKGDIGATLHDRCTQPQHDPRRLHLPWCGNCAGTTRKTFQLNLQVIIRSYRKYTTPKNENRTLQIFRIILNLMKISNRMFTLSGLIYWILTCNSSRERTGETTTGQLVTRTTPSRGRPTKRCCECLFLSQRTKISASLQRMYGSGLNNTTTTHSLTVKR